MDGYEWLHLSCETVHENGAEVGIIRLLFKVSSMWHLFKISSIYSDHLAKETERIDAKPMHLISICYTGVRYCKGDGSLILLGNL